MSASAWGVTTHTAAHLSGRSIRLDSVGDLTDEFQTIDAIVTEASWDPRCLGVLTLDTQFDNACLVRPAAGSEGARVAHAEQLQEWMQGHSGETLSVTPNWDDVRGTLSQMTAWLERLYERKGGPLCLLLDLDALARYFSLGILSYTHSRGIVKEWLFLYEEGSYGQGSSIEWQAPRTTWAAHAIPGMEGDWYPTREQLFLVSLGFDGDRVAQLIDRHDPASVVALLGDPGVVPEYPEHAREVNRAWMERSSAEVVATANAADAIQAWAELEKWLSQLGPRYNAQGLLCGTKPHSLGMAICALANDELGVVYLKPDVQIQQRITPLGRHWVYALEDLSVLPLSRHSQVE